MNSLRVRTDIKGPNIFITGFDVSKKKNEIEKKDNTLKGRYYE